MRAMKHKGAFAALLCAVLALFWLMGAAAEAEDLVLTTASVIAESDGFFSATPAARILDGDLSTIARTSKAGSYAVVDLGAYSRIDTVRLYTPYSETLAAHTYGFYIGEQAGEYDKVSLGMQQAETVELEGKPYCVFSAAAEVFGRYVKVLQGEQKNGQLCKIEILGNVVRAEKLEPPSGLCWDGESLHWEPREHAAAYRVTVSKDGEEFLTTETQEPQLDLTGTLIYNGVYSAAVTALGDGLFYADGDPSASAELQFTDGLYNIAKPAAATGNGRFYSGYDPSKCIDGLYSTYAHTGYNLAYQTDNQIYSQLQLLFPGRAELYKVVVHMPSGYKDDYYTIEYSMDGAQWTELPGERIIGVNVQPTATLKTVTSEFPPLEAQFLRITATVKENSMCHELEVYGRFIEAELLEPPAAPEVDGTRLTWQPSENAERYFVRLYLDGFLVKTIETTDNFVDFADNICDFGTYSAQVTARAEGWIESAPTLPCTLVAVEQGMVSGKTVVFSSPAFTSPNEVYQLSYMMDGSMEKAFTASLAAGYQVTAALADAVYLKTITLYEPEGLHHIAGFSVELSEDGKTWREVYRGAGPADGLEVDARWQKAAYVRLTVSQVSGLPAGIAEMTLYAGKQPGTENGGSLEGLSLPETLTGGYKLPSLSADGSTLVWSAADDAFLEQREDGIYIRAKKQTAVTVLTVRIAGQTQEKRFQVTIKGTALERPEAPVIRPGGAGGGSGGRGTVISPPVPPANPSTPPVEQPPENPLKKELAGHWAEREIGALIDRGTVLGDEDGLQLKRSVTRGEFAALLIKALEIVPQGDGGTFADVSPDDWFAPYVAEAFDRGWIRGYAGAFRPQDFITREEMAQVLYAVGESISAQPIGDGVDFSDWEQISPWARHAVDAVSRRKWMIGDTGSRFCPQQPVLREQAMTVVYRVGMAKGDV